MEEALTSGNSSIQERKNSNYEMESNFAKLIDIVPIKQITYMQMVNEILKKAKIANSITDRTNDSIFEIDDILVEMAVLKSSGKTDLVFYFKVGYQKRQWT